MGRNLWCAALMGAVVLAAGTAVRASFICSDSVAFGGDSTIVCSGSGQTASNNGVYSNTYHTYAWGVSGADGWSSLTDDRTFITGDTHTYTETVNGDPTKRVTEELYNDSGWAWTGYTLTVTPISGLSSAVFAGPATAVGAFGGVGTISSDGSTLSYGGGSALAPEATVDLSYKLILTPTSGTYSTISYLVTETPAVMEVPEPASLGLLGLSGLALLGRRRR